MSVPSFTRYVGDLRFVCLSDIPGVPTELGAFTFVLAKGDEPPTLLGGTVRLQDNLSSLEAEAVRIARLEAHPIRRAVVVWDDDSNTGSEQK